MDNTNSIQSTKNEITQNNEITLNQKISNHRPSWPPVGENREKSKFSKFCPKNQFIIQGWSGRTTAQTCVFCSF